MSNQPDNDMETSLANDLNDFLDKTGGRPDSLVRAQEIGKSVNGHKPEPSIAQQLQAHETYMARLRKRVHETFIETQREFGQQQAEIIAAYEHKVLALANDRNEALRALALDFEGKRAEYEATLNRLHTNRA